MQFAGKNILIAGGAGFLGTNLASETGPLGARLRLTVHRKPLQAAFPDAEVVEARSAPPEDCARAVEGMDVVFICSAHTSGAGVIRTTPLVHVTPNVLINSLLLEAAYQAQVKKVLLHLQRCGLSRLPMRGPSREAEMFNGDPEEVYFPAGWMKRYAEVLCRTYAEKIPNPMSTVRHPAVERLRPLRQVRLSPSAT